MLRSPRSPRKSPAMGRSPAQSGRTSPRGGTHGGANFDETCVSLEMDLLCRLLEQRACKTLGLFSIKASSVELDAIRAKMNAEGAACVFAKDVNLYAAANLLDMLLNARADPIIPCEFGPCVQAALALSAERDRVKCLRRIMASLPPGNRALLQIVVSLVAALRAKQRTNKLDQEQLDGVFAFAVYHSAGEHTVSDVSSAFLNAISQNFSTLFASKSSWDVVIEKEDELPVTFLATLKADCDQFAATLLPETTVVRKPNTRSSRKSVTGWDDVLAIMKPVKGGAVVGSKVADAKHSVSPYAKELGKLLLQGKMGAANRLCEMRKRLAEEEAAAAASAALSAAAAAAGAKEEYTGPRDEAGRPHGAGGRLKQRNGDTYEGAFVHGEQSGHGMLATADGSKYVGTFRGGVPHGSGVFTYANGDVYTGELEEDAFHGQGRYVSHNGTVYEGGFRRGLRNGQGRFQTSQGHTFIGDYVDDVMEGMGIYVFHNGDEYAGEFHRGRFHGKGTFRTAKGVVEGIFREGAYVGVDPDAQ